MILIPLGIIAGVCYLVEKKLKRYYKEEKRPFKTLSSYLHKIHLEGKNCCWYMKQGGLELRCLRGHDLLLLFPFDAMQRCIIFLLFGNLCPKVPRF